MSTKSENMVNEQGSFHGVAAFFDVDNTIINIKSMFSFLDYIGDVCPSYSVRVNKHKHQLKEYARNQFAREYINRFYYTILEGMKVSEVTRWGVDWYEKIRETDDFFIKKSVLLLQNHQANNQPVIFVSGSFSVLLDPIAQEMAVDDVIATDLVVIGDCYTGNILGDPTIGLGKYKKMQSYSIKHNIDLTLSYAYADDVSDLQMLAGVGFPRIVNPSPEILELVSIFMRDDVDFKTI